jgi:hypothetical protein
MPQTDFLSQNAEHKPVELMGKNSDAMRKASVKVRLGGTTKGTNIVAVEASIRPEKRRHLEMQLML